MLKLRTLEISDSVEYIVLELEQHLENLKGDYLVGIINNIRQTQERLFICNNSKFCALTRDVSQNHMFEVS